MSDARHGLKAKPDCCIVQLSRERLLSGKERAIKGHFLKLKSLLICKCARAWQCKSYVNIVPFLSFNYKKNVIT